MPLSSFIDDVASGAILFVVVGAVIIALDDVGYDVAMVDVG